MDDPKIRELRENEIPLLEEFIYHAIFQTEGSTPLPRSIIDDPTVAVYIEDFGRKDDHCLVADCGGKVIGAVWTRILNGQVRGFGNVDDETPEFAISLLPEYRGKGIGTLLMKAMLDLLKHKGYEKTSLAVQKDNYAVSLYQRVGFEIVDSNDEEYIMVAQLR